MSNQQVIKQSTFWPITRKQGTEPHPIGASAPNAIALQKAYDSANMGNMYNLLARHGLVYGQRTQSLNAQAACMFLHKITDGAHGFAPLHMMPGTVLRKWAESDDADTKDVRYMCDVMCEHPLPDTSAAWKVQRDAWFPEVRSITGGFGQLSKKAQKSAVEDMLGQLDAKDLEKILQGLIK